MKPLLSSILLAGILLANQATAAEPTAHYRVVDGIHLPDPVVTPGVAVTITQHALCATKWGKDARHVTEKMKEAVYANYGAKKAKDVCCEVDHLISRELGGADDTKNLWPQPWKEARWKDRLENAIHKEVCAGKISLTAAQSGIAKNWWTMYKERFQ